jgi:hypothetical protein
MPTEKQLAARAKFAQTQAVNHPSTKLSVREKQAIREYLKTGVKRQAYMSAYKGKAKYASLYAANFFKRPKIQTALEKALKESKFDDHFAVESLKKIVDGGMENIEITRPDTALKAIDTYFKITGKIGANKTPPKIDLESQAKRMSMIELKQGLTELNKKQKRLEAIMSSKAVEGEVLE